MAGRRAWAASGILLVLGALAGASAVRAHWLACRGSMLVGSVLDVQGTDFSDACLQAMDDGFSFLWPDGKHPWRAESVLGLAFVLLLAAAWAVVVATSSWAWPTRTVAALPVVLTLATALVGLAPRSDALDGAFVLLLLGVSASVLLALVVVVLRGTSSPRDLAVVALALCGPGAVGLGAYLADQAFMMTFSQANWDTPPGSGAPTVVVTALAGVTLLVVALREHAAARRPRARARA